MCVLAHKDGFTWPFAFDSNSYTYIDLKHKQIGLCATKQVNEQH